MANLTRNINAFFNPDNQPTTLLRIVRQSLSELPAQAPIPLEIIEDLSSLINMNSQEALKMMTTLLITRTVNIPLERKLHFLEQSAPQNKNAAYVCARIYAGTEICDFPVLTIPNPRKALTYFVKASELGDHTASEEAISMMLTGKIPVDLSLFHEACERMVSFGDAAAALYYGAALCGYYSEGVEGKVKLNINKDVLKGFSYLKIAGQSNDQEVRKLSSGILVSGVKDKIWPKEYMIRYEKNLSLIREENRQRAEATSPGITAG